MSELKPGAYIVTRFGMHAIDDYEEYEELLLPNQFDKLEEKDELLRNGLAQPLYTRHTPEGYVMVPVEPTDEMLSAAFRRDYNLNSKLGRKYAADNYKAMIDAAQEVKS